MKRILCVFLAAAALAGCSRQETMAELTDRVFGRAAVQFLCLDANMDSVALACPGSPVYPRSINVDGSLWTSDYKWWCSGFFPGSLWYVYEYTGDPKYKDLALKYQAGLEPLRHLQLWKLSPDNRGFALRPCADGRSSFPCHPF